MRLPSSASTAPSCACNRSTAMPSRSAARASRISRTCAAAFMIAVPLSVSERLPAVNPSSGVSDVSAVMRSIRAGCTPSCSAATWISAVLMPWPSSALPVNTVTPPSAPMRIQASSIGVLPRLPGGFATACACSARSRVAGRSEKLTTSAPPAARKPRREIGSPNRSPLLMNRTASLRAPPQRACVRPRGAPHAECACACRSGRD